MSQEKLFQAAAQDDLALAKSVLSDVVIDGRNDEGESALHIAAKNGSVKVAALLLSKEVDADIDVLDNLLRTPLHWAAKNQHLNIVELLNRHNPRKDVVDTDGQTALMLARAMPNELIVRELVRGGSPNPFAERLVLRAKIKSFIEGEDVLGRLSVDLPELIKTIDNLDMQRKLKNLCAQFEQPEKLLQFDFLSELLKSEKKEKQDKKEKSDKSEKSEKLDKNGKLEKINKADQNKTPFEKLSENLQNAFVDMDLIVKPKSDKADKSEEKIIFKRNSELFKKLNSLIAEIQLLKNSTDSKRQPILNREVITALETIEKIYINYREELCRVKGLLRLQMCQARIRVSSGFLGNNYYYLNPAAAQLFDTLYIDDLVVEEAPSAFIANIKARNHVVLKIGNTYIKKESEHDKADGTEGIETTVDSCNSVMAGQGTAPSESLRIEKQGRGVNISAAKEIKGETGQELFNQDPDSVQHLDSFNHSAQSVLAMTILVDDQKPENFIGIIIKELITRLKLISIDNDRAFRPAIQVQHLKNGQSEHFVELKSLFFSCPHMDRPIDPVFCRGFIKQSPIIFVLSILRDLLRKKEPEKLNLELILGVYHRIVQIHTALLQNPSITVHELLAIVHPLLAPYYEHIRKTKHHTLDAMNAPYSQKRPVLEQFYANNPAALKQLELAANNKTDKDCNAAQKDLLTESCSQFINQLDFATMGDIYIQGYVLDIIATDLPFIKHLRICNADALNDDRLGMLASRLPDLESISLVNCSRYNGSGLSALLLSKPSLHITIEEFSQISTVNLHHLIKHAENLTLVVGGRPYVVKKQGKMQDDVGELLRVALQHEVVHLTTALLMCGVQFTTDPNALMHLHLAGSKENKDKTTIHPLHLACNKGNFALVVELLRFGVPVDSNNADRLSALDVTVEMLEKSVNTPNEHRYQKIMLYLLERGALQCKNPVELMKRIRKSVLSAEAIKSLSPVLRQALFMFACVNNVLTPDLIPMLLSKNIETLDLNTPKALNLTSLTLTPALMTAIREHLPNLRHLNISRCDGVALEVMQVIGTMPKLISVDMGFRQILDCQLLKPDQIDQAANFERYNKKINVVSLNLKDCLPPRTDKPTQELLTKVGKFLAESKSCLYLEMYKCKLEPEDVGATKKIVLKQPDDTKDSGVTKGSDETKDANKDALINGLRKNTSLQEINLNNNSLGDAGVVNLVDALLAHPALRNLSIDSNKFSIDGAAAIGKLLHKSDTLEVVSISDNPTGEMGARAIAEAIKSRRHASRNRNKSFRLRSLNVNRNEMNEAGALALISSLMFHSLEFADFSYNEFGDNGVKALMQLLRSTETLHYLRSHHQGTSNDAIMNELEELIKRNALIYRDTAISEQIANAHELEQQHVPDLMPPEYMELQAVKAQLASLRIQRSSPSALSLSSKVHPSITPPSPMPAYSLPPSLPVVAASRTDEKNIRQKVKDKMQLLKEAGYIFGSQIENDRVTVVIRQVPEKKLPLDINNFWRCLLKLIILSREINYTQSNDQLKLKKLDKNELDRIKGILAELNITSYSSADSKLFSSAKPAAAPLPQATASPVVRSGSGRESIIGGRRALTNSTAGQSNDNSGGAQSLPREPQAAVPKSP